MRDYLKRLAVPIAAYLVITLVLPAANGAATHHEFVHHAMWVVLGCALVVAGDRRVRHARRSFAGGNAPASESSNHLARSPARQAMKALLLIPFVLAVAAPAIAHADQCELVTDHVATHALRRVRGNPT